MVKKLLIFLIVFMMIGLVPVMAEVDEGEDLGYPPWFIRVEEYEDWVDKGMEGPPPWAPEHARENYLRSLMNDENNDDDDDNDLGYPLWFTEIEGYEEMYKDWVEDGMEGPPPWAPEHAIENYNNSLMNDDDDEDDDDEGNGPPWFKEQGAVQQWKEAGQQGPPPWAGGPFKNKK